MTAPDAAGIEAALAAGLAAHVDVGGMLSEEHGYQKYVCLWGEGSDDYRWHRAHVAAALLPVVTQAQAEEREEWASYFENWLGAVGPRPPTVEDVVALLRAEHKPFGRARADESGA